MPQHESLPTGARVLVVRLSALGDVLFALETVASLAAERPDVRVDFLVEDRFASVLAGHPQIERVITVPRKRRLLAYPGAIRRLREVRYDAVLDLHGIQKSVLPLRFVRANCTLGFAPPGSREGVSSFYDVAVDLPDPLPHRAERGHHLLAKLGLSGDPAPIRLPEPAEPPTFWGELPGPRVVLHPGTSAFAAFKRWPIAHFAELARRLTARDVRVAVSIGPGEAPLAGAVIDVAPEVVPLDGAILGLLSLAAVYRDADVVVAADTGPLHLAASVGARVVALFGPKDPSLYGPRGAADHSILFRDVPCRPCRRRTCVSPQCILGLAVDTVERAVVERL